MGRYWWLRPDCREKVSSTENNVGQRETYTTTFFLFHCDSRGLFIKANSKAFQFICENGEVIERLENVQNNKYKVASPGNSNDLSTSTFTVLGTLDDTLRWKNGYSRIGFASDKQILTRKVENLYSGSIVSHLSGNSGQCSEFIRCCLGVSSAVDSQLHSHRFTRSHWLTWALT